MLLETEAMKAEARADKKGFCLEKGVVNLLPFIAKMAEKGRVNPAQAAADFHATLALALVKLVDGACRRTGYRGPVMLTGGCMANRLLTRELTEGLAARGIESYYPLKVPAGDGGLALGQVWLAHLALSSGFEAMTYSGDR